MAVVIGGTSLFGGIGSMFGTAVGLSIPAVLQDGFVIVGVQPFWQQVAVGAILIVAVYIDQRRSTVEAASPKATSAFCWHELGPAGHEVWPFPNPYIFDS